MNAGRLGTGLLLFLALLLLVLSPMDALATTEHPQALSIRPADGETNVAVWRSLASIGFDREIKIGPGSKKISVTGPGGERLCFDVYVSSGRDLMVDFNAHGDLLPNTQYQVFIPADAALDTEGNNLGREYNITFRTGADTKAPNIEVMLPVNDRKNIAVAGQNDIIGVSFSEAIELGPNAGQIALKDADGKAVAVDLVIDNKVQIKHSECGGLINNYYLYLRPKQPLQYETTYTFTLPKGAVRDKAGNVSEESGKTTFTTMAKQYLKVTGVSPKDKATGVALENKGFKVTFSEHVLDGSRLQDVYISDSRGTRYSCLTVSFNSNTLTVKPNHIFINYLPNTTYTLHIPRFALQTNDGDELDRDYALSFTTGADNLPPFMCYITPDTINMEGRVDYNNAPFTVKINEPAVLNTPGQYITLKKDSDSTTIPLSFQIYEEDVNRVCLDCFSPYPWLGSRIRIQPQQKLEPLTNYTLILNPGFVRDKAGNLLAKGDTYPFTTLRANEKPGYFDINKDPPETAETKAPKPGEAPMPGDSAPEDGQFGEPVEEPVSEPQSPQIGRADDQGEVEPVDNKRLSRFSIIPGGPGNSNWLVIAPVFFIALGGAALWRKRRRK